MHTQKEDKNYIIFSYDVCLQNIVQGYVNYKINNASNKYVYFESLLFLYQTINT